MNKFKLSKLEKLEKLEKYLISQGVKVEYIDGKFETDIRLFNEEQAKTIKKIMDEYMNIKI